MKTKPLIITLTLLAIALFLSRMIPHSANWGPALAICAFAGFLARKNPMGFVIPAIAWFATDLYLGFYEGMLFNYIALFGCTFGGISWAVLNKKYPGLRKGLASYFGFAGSGVMASTLFFLVSNFGVWFYQAPQCQPFNGAGLFTCYVGGLLFYWPTLISTTAWMLVFAGAYQWIREQAQEWLLERA